MSFKEFVEEFNTKIISCIRKNELNLKFKEFIKEFNTKLISCIRKNALNLKRWLLSTSKPLVADDTKKQKKAKIPLVTSLSPFGCL